MTREEPPESLLSPERLATLRERYNLPGVRTWHRTAKGNTHTTWILGLADDRTVVLRRYHPNFDEDAIRYEHSILTHLAGRGFPVARIIPAADGASYVSVDGGRYAVFAYCEGSPKAGFLLRKLQPHLIPSGGALLARYHRLMEGVIPEGRKVKRDERWFAQEIDRLREGVTSTGPRGRLDRYFLQQLAPLKEQLLGVGATLAAHQGRYPEAIIHGDFGPEHLLVHNGSIVAVLDFANAHLNMRVADVGRSLVEFSKGPGPWLNLGMARNFLHAYQAGNPLQADELALLPAWMIRWRLISLYYALKRYYQRRRLDGAVRAVWSLRLVQWLRAHQTQIGAIWTAIEPRGRA